MSRDCEHGQLARSCDRCADAAEIADLHQQLAAERKRCSKLRRLLQEADVLFTPLCKDATAWNWLDEARASCRDVARQPHVEMQP
jgi:hypothetical protein